MNYSELDKAHRFSSNNKPALEEDQKCGCFCCLEIFRSSEIEEWIIHDNPSNYLGTAICPRCEVDSVIGESSGIPITAEFLSEMHDFWFNGGSA